MSEHEDKRGMRRRMFLKTTGAVGASVAAGGLLPWSRSALAAGGEFDLFRVAMWSGTPNLDPEQNSIRTCIICQNWLFDPMVWRNENTNALEPYFAHEYGFVGKNTWRFNLREGVTFHNGKPVDANAVRFSMLRRQDEKTGSPWRKQFLDVTDIKVVDQYTVDFVCSNPFPTLPAYLPVFSIMEPGYYSENSKEHLALNPLGSGPFRLEEFKPDDVLRVTRNDDYWGKRSVAKKVEAPVILESATRVAGLLAGDLNIAPRPTVEDFDRINASDNARVSATIGNRIVLSAFNYDMAPFDNKKVRQALNYAVNQKEVNDIYLRGMGELMASAIPSTVLGHDPGIELYPYDPEMARSLLKEAGHPNGFETTIEAVPEWMVAGIEVTEAIVHYLREVGVKAKIQIYDAGTMASRITSGKAGPMYMLSWGGNSTFDADSYIGTLMGSGAWSCNSMPEVDKLVAAGRATADQAERIGIYQEACRFIHEDAPWVFLHLQPNTYGASSNHDWEGRPDELIPLWYLNRTA